MAEGILRHLSGGAIYVQSAGRIATSVNPFAIGTMSALGIDISGHVSKPLELFANEPWDFVVTLCDGVLEDCPDFPGGTNVIQWNFGNPASVEGGEEEIRAAFSQTAQGLMARARLLLALIERATENIDTADDA